MDDDTAAITAIRERIVSGWYEVDFEHVDFHTALEGFTLDDAERAVRDGDVIERAIARDRWLFCGKVPSLRQDARFLGRWLHVSVEWDGDTTTVIVTAYRPNRLQWRTERRRR